MQPNEEQVINALGGGMFEDQGQEDEIDLTTHNAYNNQ